MYAGDEVYDDDVTSGIGNHGYGFAGDGVSGRTGDPDATDPTCCACRWIAFGEECGHPESDGITSPHTHCAKHAPRG